MNRQPRTVATTLTLAALALLLCSSISACSRSADGAPDAPTPVAPVQINFLDYNASWIGEADFSPLNLGRLSFRPEASCVGSRPSYGETLIVSVNASGTGTLTMKDAKDFDRPYTGTISSGLAFSGQGSFSLLGSPVPGQLSVTFNSLTQLTFQETTTYRTGSSSCTNTYRGTLTKQ